MLCLVYEYLLTHYAPAHGALSDDACLASVCLSHTSGLSREQRPMKTKISTEVAHITRYWDTTFEVKRSRSPGCFGCLYWQANIDIELVMDPYVCMMY